ncbi:LOG family protein [Leptolyngbya sp. PCC 6406]|uniref:SLOG cluster 4 domain-containing protein n=1 Tax=Leptolyngbya sp. PCC 6406 TaxID=1173264 RepID=UPI0002AD0FEF|nr:LOG family protein [Leptolyngbya sp. PCC 6406]
MASILIGVMGPGETATTAQQVTARALGTHIAQQDWVLLTGGRNVGVMAAASEGAHNAGGLVVGILPGANTQGMSPFVDIPILTDQGQGRNAINVLSCQVVVACGLGPGTLAEIGLALKAQRPLVLMEMPPTLPPMVRGLATSPVTVAAEVSQAITQIHQHLLHGISVSH